MKKDLVASLLILSTLTIWIYSPFVLASLYIDLPAAAEDWAKNKFLFISSVSVIPMLISTALTCIWMVIWIPIFNTFFPCKDKETNKHTYKFTNHDYR